jgi:hypothetical protein
MTVRAVAAERREADGVGADRGAEPHFARRNASRM